MLSRRLFRRLIHQSFSTFPEHEILRMPALSPTMETGMISKWHIEPPSPFFEGDSLCTIDTDKASMEFESLDDGILAKIFINEGEEAAVGDPIGIIVEDADFADAFKNYKLGDSDSKENAEKQTEGLSEDVPLDSDANTNPVVVETQPNNATNAGLVLASPAARHHAKLHGVDLSAVNPSGPRNYIQKSDVLFVSNQSSNTKSTNQMNTTTLIEPERINLTPMRKTIASRLTESWTTIPYYSLSMDINMTELMHIRKQIDHDVSVTDFLVKACDKALQDVPEVNCHWIDNGDGDVHMLQYHTSDISVAVATDSGLVTPVVRGVNTKSLPDIGKETKDLFERARTNQLGMEDYQGGTFTISNLGGFGIRNFTAIINPPQSAILAVGAGRDEYGKMMTTMTLGCDHRVIDGAIGSQWLSSLKKYIESPVNILV